MTTQPSDKKELLIGGSLEKAVKGEVPLSPVAILKEGAQITIKNYVSFFPALLGLFLAQLAILLLTLKVQLGNPMVFFNAVITGDGMSVDLMHAGMLANYASDILSAPLYISICLMALNHCVGLPSKPSYLVKGFPFAVASIITAIIMAVLQGVANQLIPVIGLLLSMGFGFAMFLLCEKRVTPIKAVQYSVMATLRKIMPITAIYAVFVLLFVLSFATAGLAMFWALPFFFNTKAILYRNLFGITLKVNNAQEVPMTESDAA